MGEFSQVFAITAWDTRTVFFCNGMKEFSRSSNEVFLVFLLNISALYLSHESFPKPQNEFHFNIFIFFRRHRHPSCSNVSEYFCESVATSCATFKLAMPSCGWGRSIGVFSCRDGRSVDEKVFIEFLHLTTVQALVFVLAHSTRPHFVIYFTMQCRRREILLTPMLALPTQIAIESDSV